MIKAAHYTFYTYDATPARPALDLDRIRSELTVRAVGSADTRTSSDDASLRNQTNVDLDLHDRPTSKLDLQITKISRSNIGPDKY